MLKSKHLWWLVLWTLIGCGPDTIFVRPGLDTPAQHVSNGYALLDQNKLDDACREFQRAQELAPYYTEAFVGLGLAYGRQGELEKGLQVLEQAKPMANSDAEWASIEKAYTDLLRLKKKQSAAPSK